MKNINTSEYNITTNWQGIKTLLNKEVFVIQCNTQNAKNEAITENYGSWNRHTMHEESQVFGNKDDSDGQRQIAVIRKMGYAKNDFCPFQTDG